MAALRDAEEIIFPDGPYRRMIGHARRKLEGDYLPTEEAAPKAYGLIGGRVQGCTIEVIDVFPLRVNLRFEPRYREYFDDLMEEVAVPSETPFEHRGWVAAPSELAAADESCSRQGGELIGSYHMHRVPWSHDPIRDSCTELDRRLAAQSGLWMMIVSMVEPDHPRVRAFFEGCNETEAAVHVRTAPQ